MCGIVGSVSLGKANVSTEWVKSMQNQIHHRGPDGEGFWRDAQVALAMKRLSIIDVEGGGQPLFNEDESLIVVGNGEIYNYVELNRSLRRKGHRLKTGSDIETIVHLYEEYGLGFLKKLRGMFAIALYDKRRGKIILARDRMGEKPLYYARLEDRIVFASEMKALLNHPRISRRLNNRAIDDFFHYYFVPEPGTLFVDVKKLAPGGYLEVDLKEQSLTEGRYWSPNSIEPDERGRKETIQEIRDRFFEACKLTFRSDVPVGVSLSGGLDSSAILAVMAREYKNSLKAFSIGYKDSSASDERKQARYLAEKLDIEFIEGEIDTKEMIDGFPQLIFDMDDPIADIAAHPIRAVSRLAKKNGISVLLGGIGGDELFWGYSWTQKAVQRMIERGGNKIPDFYAQTPGFVWAERLAKKLYPKEFADSLPRDSAYRFLESELSAGKLKLARHGLDLVRDLWLKSNCLVLSDRLSMSASVELRSPFLDYRLVESVLANKQVVLGFQRPPKYWFKLAMKGILPDEILNRPKKGFTPPVGKWLYGLIRKYLSLLDDGFLVNQGVINRGNLGILTKAWPLLPRGWYTVYQLILLEIWGREFVEGVKPSDIG